MRDALNATGRPIYFSITQALTHTDRYEKMHCYGDGVFTVIPWVAAGLDPVGLCNSALIEYCNNEDIFGSTDAVMGPGGFLSNLDSQQLLTYDNLTQPGFWSDNDMLEVCNGGQSVSEYRSQFSTWAILASPLILGHDPRSQSPECLSVILNKDVIRINQDALGLRGKLVLQWPSAVYPPTNGQSTLDRPQVLPKPYSKVREDMQLQSPPAPYPLASLEMRPCTGSPDQLFAFNTSDSTIRTADGNCLTYGGYTEANFKVTSCTGWSVPGIGSQLWHPSGPALNITLNVVDNTEKVMDVYDCKLNASGSVQVCTFGGADCYSSPRGPAGCGLLGQFWNFDSSAKAGSTISSSINGFSHCIEVAPIPPPPIILQVWAKPLANGDVAVLAFNRHTVSTVANITMPMLGWPSTATASFYDVWQHAPLGVFSSLVSVTVEPHDVVMLRATRVS